MKLLSGLYFGRHLPAAATVAAAAAAAAAAQPPVVNRITHITC